MPQTTLKRILKKILPFKLQTALRRCVIQLKKIKTLCLIPQLKPLKAKNSPQYIVSLTSFGKRLIDTAPFAIIALLNQSVQPDRIILWAGYGDEKNIAGVLKKLIKKGLEIRFCTDIKSYTKLIPALEIFPHDCMITADDDIYYPKNWLELLIQEHKKNPGKIICHRAHGIKVDKSHNILSYSKWSNRIDPDKYFSKAEGIPGHQPECIFPTGVGGILYPPKCFHKDITNRELFLKLAPHADDIWFWAMAVINREYFGEESPYVVIGNCLWRNLPGIDPELQTEGNALWRYNCIQHGNDTQLNAVIDQYPQLREIFKKIEPLET